MARQRVGLPRWLKMQIESGKYSGVRWVDKDKLIFSIPWKHASSNKWVLKKDAALFKDWAVHKGKHKEGSKPCPKKWKATFRCAMNASRTIKECTDSDFEKDGYRLYQFIREGKSGETEAEKENSKYKFDSSDNLFKNSDDLRRNKSCQCSPSQRQSCKCNDNGIKREIKREDCTNEKKYMDQQICDMTTPSVQEILKCLNVKKEDELPSCSFPCATTYFNPFQNTTSLYSNSNRYNIENLQQAHAYLEFLQAIQNKGNEEKGWMKTNNNENIYANPASNGSLSNFSNIASPQVNYDDSYSNSRSDNSLKSEDSPYQPINAASYASSIGSASSSDELAIIEDDLSPLNCSESFSSEKDMHEVPDIFKQVIQDQQVPNESLVKQIINMDPFFSDANIPAMFNPGYQMNEKSSVLQNLVMGDNYII